MKLSIITVNYNNRDGLNKTIRSVRNQKFKDFELIIIDGASTDGSVELIRNYSEIISYFVSEPDNGLYEAMNKAIKVSKGDYCLFLNSGDYLVSKNVLSKVLDSKSSGADLMIGKQLFIDSRGKKSKGPKIRKTDLNISYFFSSTIPHQATFIKRKLFDAVGLYNESYKVVADWIFWFEAIVIHKCSVEILNVPVSYMESGGISANMDNCTNEMSTYFMERYPNPGYAEWNLFLNLGRKAIIQERCNQHKLSSFLVKIAYYIAIRI